MDCIKDCEFIGWKDNRFYCNYFEESLIHVRIDDEVISILRCYECECAREENVVDDNGDDISNIRDRIEYIMEEFNDFSVLLDENTEEVYKILDKMEDTKDGG